MNESYCKITLLSKLYMGFHTLRAFIILLAILCEEI